MNIPPTTTPAGGSLTRLVMPPTWDKYKWPRWVPEDVRRQLREFWCESFGRSPAEWHKGTVCDPYNHQPAMGEKVTAKIICRSGRHFTGRWVPMWNNIGRVVARGRVETASTGGITKRHNTEVSDGGPLTPESKPNANPPFAGPTR
jgi:hypothetical protein